MCACTTRQRMLKFCVVCAIRWTEYAFAFAIKPCYLAPWATVTRTRKTLKNKQKAHEIRDSLFSQQLACENTCVCTCMCICVSVWVYSAPRRLSQNQTFDHSETFSPLYKRMLISKNFFSTSTHVLDPAFSTRKTLTQFLKCVHTCRR